MKTKSQLFSGLFILFGILTITTNASASETPRKTPCSKVCCKRAIKRLTKAASEFIASFQRTPTTMLDLEMREFKLARDDENGLRKRHPSQLPGTPDYGIQTPSSFQTDTDSSAPRVSAEFGGQTYNPGPASPATTGDCVTTAAGGNTSPFFTGSFPLPVFPND